MHSCICKRKTETYDYFGRGELGRYIDKGDECIIGPINENLMIEVTYPTPAGERRAYVRSLQSFAKKSFSEKKTDRSRQKAAVRPIK